MMKLSVRGLANPGSLCYLNSVVQQLIQFQSFRTHVLAFPDDSSLEIADDVSYNCSNIHQHFLRQLKALFVQLTCIDDTAPVDSLALAQTILDPRATDHVEDNSGDDEDEGQMPYTLDPDAQMDVSSFLSAFLSQLATATALYEKDENDGQQLLRLQMSESVPFLQDIQGEIVNELTLNSSPDKTSVGDNPAGRATSTSSGTERFFYLSVCVGEVPVETIHAESSDQRIVLNDLRSSLSQLFREELVQCTWAKDRNHLTGKDDAAVATKRSILRRESLPRHLFIHLKRFRFDQDKMRQVKLHDRFDFPFELDVAQYTTHCIDAESWEQRNDCNTSNRSGSSSSARTNNSTKYELSGVIVHRGSARNGHYFSLVKQRYAPCTAGLTDNDMSARTATGTGTGIATGRWFKADDDDVSEFDPADMEYVAFGHDPRSAEESACAHDGAGGGDCDGAERIADDTEHLRTKKSKNRKQSAFMLIYDMVT